MGKITCAICGVRVTFPEDERPTSVLCPQCATYQSTLASSDRHDEPSRPRARPSSSKAKARTKRQPVPFWGDPQSIVIGAAAAFLVVCVGIMIFRAGAGGAPAGGRPAGGKRSFDLVFPPIAWEVPFGGVPEDPMLPTGTLPKGVFDKSRNLVAIGPGPQYLVYQPDEGLRQGRFDRALADLVDSEREVGKGVRGGFDFTRWHCAAAATGEGRVVLETRSEIIVWGPNGDRPECTVPLKVRPSPHPDPEDGPELRQTWVGWAGSRVLYRDGGKLVAFDPTTRTQLFSVGEKYQRPALVAPNGAWVILSVGRKHLEVVDTRSGKCLGRFGGRGDWQRLALSPDGKRLAMIRQKGRATTDFSTWVVDLATGAIERVQYDYPVEDIAWLDRDRLLIVTMDHRGVIRELATGQVRYDLPFGFETAGTAGRFLGGRADGRLQFLVKNEADGSHEFHLGTPQYPPLDVAFGPHADQPLHVEVDASHEKFREFVKDQLEASLREHGYRLGPGGWKLAIDGTIASTGVTMKRTFRWGGTTNHQVPAYLGKLRLVDPKGKVLQERNVGGSFPLDGPEPEYDEHGSLQAPRKSWGGGLDYGEYMMGVLAEVTVDNIAAEGWPPTVIRSEKGLQALPVPIKLRIDPRKP